MPKVTLIEVRELSKIYTPSVFDLFQNEFVLFATVYLKHKDETRSLFEYVIGLIDHDREWRVTCESVLRVRHEVASRDLYS